MHPDNTKRHKINTSTLQILWKNTNTNSWQQDKCINRGRVTAQITNATMKQHVWIDIQLAGWAIDLNIDRLKGVVLCCCCAFGQTLIMVILGSKSFSCSQKRILERAPLLICELYLYIYILNLFPDVWLKANILDSFNK